MSPLGNSLLGDEVFVSSGTAAGNARDGGAVAAVVRSSDGENIPRYVALMVVFAVAVIVAIHFAGLRAMVTVGGR